MNSGDTLFDISQKYSVDLCELMVFNQIADPALVSVGSVITILYDRDNPKRSFPYPFDMVRIDR